VTRRGIYGRESREREREIEARDPQRAMRVALERVRELLAAEPPAGVSSAANELGVKVWHGRHRDRWLAYWTDAAGVDHAGPWASSEGAAVEAARLAIRNGADGPSVFFVARMRGTSVFELMQACGAATADAPGSRLDTPPGMNVPGVSVVPGTAPPGRSPVVSPGREEGAASEVGTGSTPRSQGESRCSGPEPSARASR
jgi:hypothetical protein